MSNNLVINYKNALFSIAEIELKQYKQLLENDFEERINEPLEILQLVSKKTNLDKTLIRFLKELSLEEFYKLNKFVINVKKETAKHERKLGKYFKKGDAETNKIKSLINEVYDIVLDKENMLKKLINQCFDIINRFYIQDVKEC